MQKAIEKWKKAGIGPKPLDPNWDPAPPDEMDF
jgi:hypothetical protein